MSDFISSGIDVVSVVVTDEKICEALDITPGELFEYVSEGEGEKDSPIAKLIKATRSN